MIGVPPTAGFLSKWYILEGAVQADRMVAVAVIVASTLLNAGYFLPIVYAAFFRKPAATGNPHDHEHGEGPLFSVVALTATAAVTVILFFYPDVPLGLARQLMGSLQ
jgi:multicomponent Na+:H+ antiporter subunit D